MGLSIDAIAASTRPREGMPEPEQAEVIPRFERYEAITTPEHGPAGSTIARLHEAAETTRAGQGQPQRASGGCTRPNAVEAMIAGRMGLATTLTSARSRRRWPSAWS